MSDFREFWRNPNRKDGVFTFRSSAYTTIAELEYIAELLMEWIDKEDALTAEEFYLSKNIYPGVFHQWLKRCPILNEAWEICVERIGERRERKALKGELNASLVLATHALYNKKYRAWKREERKHAEEGSKQTIVVVRDKMPETPEVDCVKPEGND